MDLHIEGQHVKVEPETQQWVTQQLETLNEPYHDILHAQVTLVKHEGDHKRGEEARALLTLSGKTINATSTADTFDDALFDVMDGITRQLRDFRTLRQPEIQPPKPRPRGRIIRLFRDCGYGLIETESHREVSFHANSVHHIPFEALQVGMTVDLDIEAGHAGPQATRVQPLQP